MYSISENVQFCVRTENSMGCDADQLACTNDGRYDHSTWLTEWFMDQYESAKGAHAKGARKGWIKK